MRAPAVSVMPGNALSARALSVLHRKPFRRRAVRIGLVALNVAMMVAVLGVVLANPTRSTTTQQLSSLTNTSLPVGPVDRVASVNIAATAARMAGLPETIPVLNQADSEQIEQVVASANQAVVSKPQSVSSNFVSNKNIHSYVTQAGDTVSSIAAKFGVSSNSIMWSNNLRTNTVAVGQQLSVPPVNGIVYTVKSGDTSSSLATAYHASEDKIIAYNDAYGGLPVGERIIIPDGTITAAPVARFVGLAWGGVAIYGFNGYDWGYCTWYVATQIAVPANWGNASTWAAGARAAGWHVSSTPTAGAIAQTPYAAGGLGHVGIVDSVSADGSQVLIRDMNGIAGFDRVGTAWEATSKYPNYITH